MKIINSYPPNIDDIRKAFKISDSVVFTYRDCIYNPGGGNIADHLMAHEQTHEKQQGDDPEGWWKKYIADKEFRLNQEVEAYRNQFRFFKSRYRDRNMVHRFLRQVSFDLSSEIYGNIVSFQEAFKLISR